MIRTYSKAGLLPISAFGGDASSANRSPAPQPPRSGFHHSFFSPNGDARFIKSSNLYAYPAGADFCSCKSQQNTLGALPQDPCRWLCWIRIDLRREPEINPYCAQNRSQGSHRRICPFPPPPFPMAGKGLGWAGKCRAAVQRSGYVRVCKSRKPLTLKYLLSRPIVPLLGGGDRGGGSPFCAPAQRR